MTKKLFIALLTLVLTASFLVSGAACSKKSESGETTNSGETENAGETDGVNTAEASGKPVLGSADGAGLSYYLRLDGVEGDSTQSSHNRWIEVIDFSLGAEEEYSTGMWMQTGSGKYTPITFTHKVDRATPRLQRLCMNGALIGEGELEVLNYEAGRSIKVFLFSFYSLRIVNTSVKTVTDGDGRMILLEEVTMVAKNESTVITENVQSVNAGNGMRYYLKADGIQGECTASQHSGWVEATGFAHGAYMPALESDPDVYTGDGFFKEVVFTHMFDSASSDFMNACVKGRRISSGEFHATKSVAGKETIVYKVVLEGISVVKTSVRTVTDENGKSSLVEEVTLLAEKEKWTYASIGIDDTESGTSEAEYDQARRA